MANQKIPKENSDRTIYILEYLLVLELYRLGLGQGDIGKRLGVATSKINTMLKGIRKD